MPSMSRWLSTALLVCVPLLEASVETGLLQRSCGSCHNARSKTGGFNLDELLAAPFVRQFRQWETVAEQVATHTMPPRGAPAPTQAERDRIVAWIDRQVATAPVPPGAAPPAPVRRLTRAEFDNSIRHLTRADIDLSSYFPPDGASQDGLPNNASTLFLSGPQLEKILAAAKELMSHATFSPTEGLRFTSQPARELRHQERVHQAAERLAEEYFRASSRHLDPRVPEMFIAAWRAKNQGAPASAETKRWLDFFALDYEKEAIKGGSTADDFAKARMHFAPLFDEFRNATAQTLPSAAARFGGALRRLLANDDFIEQLRAGDHSHPFDVAVQPGTTLHLSAVEAAVPNGNGFATWLDPVFHFDGGITRPAALTGTAERDTSTGGGPLHVFSQAAVPNVIRTKLLANPRDPSYGEYTIPWKQAYSVRAPSVLTVIVPAGARRFTVRGALQDLARVVPGQKGRPWHQDGMVQFAVGTRPPGNDPEPGARLTLATRAQQTQIRRFYDNLVTRNFPSRSYWIKILDERYGLPHRGVMHEHPEELAAKLPGPPGDALRRAWKEYELLCSEPREVRERTLAILNNEYRRLMGQKKLQVKGREATFDEVRAEAGPEVREELAQLEKMTSANRAALRTSAELHLRAFAERAFRRPVTPIETARLMKLYDTFLADENAYTQDALRFASGSVIASPEFLYLRDDPAARLSHFLWSAPPDRSVTTARAMLRDPRSVALADQFAGSWLRFRQIRGHDRPESPSLREAMYHEARMLVHRVIRDDLSIFELLDSGTTFLNEELARHYGIAGVKGEQFRPVAIDRSQRGGLLGTGAILTLTSHPKRTSPVGRGVFVLTEVLGTPPPPPPPNAANQFEEKVAQMANASPRQQLESHRANPKCASCHARIDPAGFALEGFDETGRVRSADTRSELPGGRVIASFADLKQMLMTGRERNKFTRHFCRQLLGYALGRAVEWQDLPLLRKMEQSLAARGYRFSAAVGELIQSPQFRGSAQ